MFRKLSSLLVFAAAIVLAASVGARAQSAPVTGTVEVQNADGTRKPVVGALVEVFRTDIKASSPPAKTNSKGQFSFAGLQAGWTYILAVSGSGIAPNYMRGVRPGQEKILITVSPGDGRKMTEEEAKTAASAPAAAPGAAPMDAAAVKKAQADFEVQKKAVEDKNARSEKANEISTRAIAEGKVAYEAKNWDLAIAKYDEGYQADPNFVGSAPVFLRNKGLTLTDRAVDTYNKGIKLTEATERQAVGEKVRADLVDAAKAFMTGWTVLKSAPATDKPENFESNKTAILSGSVGTFKRAVETDKANAELVEVAKVLVPEYVAVETDSAKKLQASMVYADLLRVSGNQEEAVTAYMKILETSPDNFDALAGAGLMLVDIGWIKTDKAKSQEGANLLQKFVSVAPDTHKLKIGAVEYLEILKKENVTPDKKAAPAGRRKP